MVAAAEAAVLLGMEEFAGLGRAAAVHAGLLLGSSGPDPVVDQTNREGSWPSLLDGQDDRTDPMGSCPWGFELAAGH